MSTCASILADVVFSIQTWEVGCFPSSAGYRSDASGQTRIPWEFVEGCLIRQWSSLPRTLRILTKLLSLSHSMAKIKRDHEYERISNIFLKWHTSLFKSNQISYHLPNMAGKSVSQSLGVGGLPKSHRDQSRGHEWYSGMKGGGQSSSHCGLHRYFNPTSPLQAGALPPWSSLLGIVFIPPVSCLLPRSSQGVGSSTKNQKHRLTWEV